MAPQAPQEEQPTSESRQLAPKPPVVLLLVKLLPAQRTSTTHKPLHLLLRLPPSATFPSSLLPRRPSPELPSVIIEATLSWALVLAWSSGNVAQSKGGLLGQIIHEAPLLLSGRRAWPLAICKRLSLTINRGIAELEYWGCSSQKSSQRTAPPITAAKTVHVSLSCKRHCGLRYAQAPAQNCLCATQPCRRGGAAA
jgi:hypothetical protein